MHFSEFPFGFVLSADIENKHRRADCDGHRCRCCSNIFPPYFPCRRFFLREFFLRDAVPEIHRIRGCRPVFLNPAHFSPKKHGVFFRRLYPPGESYRFFIGQGAAHIFPYKYFDIFIHFSS